MVDILSAVPNVVSDYPTAMEGPPGSSLIDFVRYTPFDTLTPGETVNTLLIDFATPQILDAGMVENAINAVASLFPDGGEELLAYALFGGTTTDVAVPQQICIGEWCFTPPFAGNILATVNVYRLWILTRPSVVMGNIAYRPLAVVPILILAATIFTTLYMLGYFGIWTGAFAWIPPALLPPGVPKPTPPSVPVPIPPAITPPGGTPGHGGGTGVPPKTKEDNTGMFLTLAVVAAGIGLWAVLATKQSRGGA